MKCSGRLPRPDYTGARNDRLYLFFGLFIALCLAVAGVSACGLSAERTPENTIVAKDEEFTVLPLETMTVVVNMDKGKLLKGTITVTGGNNDIKVYVKDDFGNTAFNLGTIAGTFVFSYLAVQPGFYTIYFDNSFSVAVNKEIKLHYEVR